MSGGAVTGGGAPYAGATAGRSAHADVEWSLVWGDLPWRLQRRLRLVPDDHGLGIARRAVFWALFAWLPMVLLWLAQAGGQSVGEAPGTARHWGVHVLLLAGIPLLIVAEAVALRLNAPLLRQFESSGLVDETNRAAYQRALSTMVRLRSLRLPWVLIAAIAWGSGILGGDTVLADAVPPAAEAWYRAVGRPIVVALLLGWVWRAAIVAFTLVRIARVDLALVPTHPDRMGGLGFVQRYAIPFGVVGLALALAPSARWAEAVLWDGVSARDLLPRMAWAIAITLLLFAGPCLAFSPRLWRTKRDALLGYGALLSRRDRRVHRRWIEGADPIDAELGHDAELGTVSAANEVYRAVDPMRLVPVGLAIVAAIAVPMALPFVAVLALQVPLGELLADLRSLLF